MATFFQFGTTRKYILAMLNLFNNIKTQRVIDGALYENKVPVIWGSKERLVSFEERNNVSGIRVRLPKMALTLDGIEYDSTRKINRLSKDHFIFDKINVAQFPPVPYKFSFTLHMMTKNLDDYFQIIEQILPYFNPVRNVNVYEYPDQEESTSIMVSITNIVFDPDIDFDEEGGQRLVQGSISFVLHGSMYMPIKQDSNIIHKIFIKYYPSMKTDQTKFEEFLIQAVDSNNDGELNSQDTIETDKIAGIED